MAKINVKKINEKIREEAKKQVASQPSTAGTPYKNLATQLSSVKGQQLYVRAAIAKASAAEEAAKQAERDAIVSGNKSRAREQAKQRAQLEKDVLASEKKKAQAKEAEKKSMVGSSYAAAFQTREEEYKQAQERSSIANQEANEAKKRMETAQKERQAGYDAVRNRNRQRRENEIFQEGMAEIAAMPEADRAELERYANGKYAETVQRFTPGFDAPPVLQSDVDNRAQALFEKYGEQRVKELADVVRRSQNADMTEAAATQGAAFGENHGFLTNVAVSAGTGFLSGIPGVVDRAASAQLSSGIFDSPDANALGNVGSVFSGNIDEAYKKDKIGAVSLAYDVAKSIGEMGLQIAFGPASSAIMAARGFSDGYQTAVQNGANDAQAIAMGAGQAVLEAATEALPLDELLKVAKGGKQPFLQLIGNTIKQAGIESGTELTSMVGTWLWEYLVMGDDRSYNRSISDAVANGMSYEDAKAQADQNRVQEAVQTFAVSALTGGISYGATGAVTNARTGNETTNTGKYSFELKEETPAQTTQPEPVQNSTDQAFEAVAREINNPSPTVAERFAKKMTEEEVKQAFETEFAPAKEGDQLQDSSVTLDKDIPNQDTVVNSSEQKPSDSKKRPKNQEDIAYRKERREGKAKDFIRNNHSDAMARLLQAERDNSIQGAEYKKLKEAALSDPKAQNILKRLSSLEGDPATWKDSDIDDAILDVADAVFSADSLYAPLAESGWKEFPGKKQSKLYENTMKRASDPNIRKQGRETKYTDPDTMYYEPHTEAEQNAVAAARTDTPQKIAQEAEYLSENNNWTDTDIKTSFIVGTELMKSKNKEAFKKLAAKRREAVTKAGQLIQALAEYTRKTTASGAADTAIVKISELGKDGIDPKFYKKQGFEKWAEGVENAVIDVANDIESVADGDTKAMRDIVNSIAQLRRTTGRSNQLTANVNRALNKMDFDTMKAVAIKQLSMIPEDFTKRTVGEKANTIRATNMLASAKTVMRNIQGNGVTALLDTLSDSSIGRLADIAMSKATGVRTVGNEYKHSSAALKASKDAFDFALMCIDLNIPMDSQAAYAVGSDSSVSSGKTNTFSMQGGAIERFMAGYVRYMKYALEATDVLFQEYASTSAKESVKALGEASGLTDADIEAIGEYTGQRRTMKEDRLLAKASGGVKTALNKIGVEGFGAGDLVMPFSQAPSNEIQTTVDYTGVGIAEGIKGFIDVNKMAKKMETVTDTEQRKKMQTEIAVAQRRAASNFARGVAGPIMIAIATAGAAAGITSFTSSDDWDEENADLNRYKEGGQINWSALYRAMTGQDSAERAGDIVSGVDSIGYLSSIFALGEIFAQDITVKEKGTKAFGAIYNSIIEMPMMQGLKDLTELIEGVGELGNGDEDALTSAAGTFIGDMASGAFPAFFRNVAQATDPVIRDTSDSNALKAAGKRTIAAIPFASKFLPAKYDPLTGGVQQRDENGAASLFNRMVAPDAWHRLESNDIADMLDDISEQTGDSSIYPMSRAPGSFNYGGEKISIDGKDDTEKYMKVYSEAITMGYTELKNSEEFNSLTPAEQTERLKAVEKNAKARAEASIVGSEGFSEKATEEIFRLNDATLDDSVFYEPPSKTIEYTDTNGYKQTVDLTAEQYGVLSSTERDTYAAAIDGLLSDETYKKLSPENQLQAAKYAKQYATESAKKAALSDYYVDPGGWTEEVGSKDPAQYIAEKVETEVVTRSIEKWAEDINRGFKTEQSSDDMAKAFDDYSAMPNTTKNVVKEQAEGNVKRYMEARTDGESHTDVTKVMESVIKSKVNTNSYDAYKVIAETAGNNHALADALMMAYMPDDDSREEKYNAARESLGLSPVEFVASREVYDSISGKGAKNKRISAFMEEFDLTRQEATAMYYLWQNFTTYKERYG